MPFVGDLVGRVGFLVGGLIALAAVGDLVGRVGLTVGVFVGDKVLAADGERVGAGTVFTLNTACSPWGTTVVGDAAATTTA